MKSPKTKVEQSTKARVEKVEAAPDRRNFMVQAAAVVVGGLVALFPPLAGLAMFLDPLRRQSQAGQFIPVTRLDEIPPDGVPRAYSLVADRTDAWNFYPQEPVGAVYLRRTEESEKPEALSSICPHLGCFVDFRNAQGVFKCPCHESSFEPSGVRIDPDNCPSARDLDTLEVEVREGGEVWVKFEKFKGGTAEKTPEA